MEARAAKIFGKVPEALAQMAAFDALFCLGVFKFCYIAWCLPKKLAIFTNFMPNVRISSLCKKKFSNGIQ